VMLRHGPALCHQAANHWHRYAQNGRRRPVIDNASWGHGHAWHRAVLTQIFRPEQIPGDPAKLVGVAVFFPRNTIGVTSERTYQRNC